VVPLHRFRVAVEVSEAFDFEETLRVAARELRRPLFDEGAFRLLEPAEEDLTGDKEVN
jgi:hypothetical protein